MWVHGFPGHMYKALRLQLFFPRWLTRGSALHPLLKGTPGPWFSFHTNLRAELDSREVCHPEVCHRSSGRMRSFLSLAPSSSTESSSPDPPTLSPVLILKTTQTAHQFTDITDTENTILAAKTLLKTCPEHSTGFPATLNPDLYHCDCTITQTQETKKEKIDFPKPSVPLFT